MSVTAIFKFTKTLRRLHQGPLGIYVDELVALLEAQGYSRKSTDEILRVVADFSRWLYGRRLGVGDVDADRVRSFLVHRRRTRSVGRSDPAALRKMLDLLYKKGVGHIASPPKPVGQCERAKEDFARYLLQERGLSAATLKCYLPVISQFLAERFEDGAVKFEALVPTDVVGFVQRRARGHHSHSRAQLLGKALRAFLRHLRRSTWQHACLQWRSGPSQNCPSVLLRVKSARFSIIATARPPWDGATTRCSCCSLGSGCAPAKWLP